MGSIGAAISRNRQQSETKSTWNPDLEPTQQGYADALYGRGAMIGSYGMSGGQYPTIGKDPAGFGSGGYGYPGQYQGKVGNSQGYQGNVNANRGPSQQEQAAGGVLAAGTPGLGNAIGAAHHAMTGHGGGSYWGPGNTGKPGAGSLYYGQGQPAGGGGGGSDLVGNYDPSRAGGGPNTYGGGGYQFGGGGDGQGYGNYAAMQPYQFGSEGATGDINATGAAAYGGFGQASQGYGQLGRQYARMGQQGVSQQERANLMSASNEAIQGNLAAYRDMIGNRAAQSGNTAGYSGALARLGATSGQQLEAADRANQTSIMAENQRRKEAGLVGQAGALQGGLGAAQGQAGLYGTGTGYASNLLAGRGRLASLKQRDYTQGAGTGGTVSYSGSMGSLGGG